MRRIWTRLGFLLVLCMILFAATGALAETTASPVGRIKIEIRALTCGQEMEPDEAPSCEIKPTVSVEQGDSAWVAACDAEGYTPLQGVIEGGQAYTAYVTLVARPGYCFNAGTCVALYNDESMSFEPVAPLLLESDRLVIVHTLTAGHEWDYDASTETSATCVSEGHEHMVCAIDPSHIVDVTDPIEPNAHEWSEWEIVRGATRSQEGERRHTCALCGKVETEAIGKTKLPYAEIYEPDTSWIMSATVAWRSGPDALSVASASERPATAFVWLDADLNVYDRNGALISSDLGGYIDATAGSMIPAFHIADARTAAALKAFLPNSGLLDCFVVSTPENKKLVKDVADLVHVRGMLDYTAATNPSRDDLLDMVASTNGAHGKVILISEDAATYENIRFLQKLASTVWVKTPTDTRTIMTVYTNGANGVVVDDYQAAIRAEEFFDDDVPSLLRVPFIIGHRGDPSTYVENTLDSARGAFEEGVDSVENDIQLSADGELFILHDDTPQRLLMLEELGEDYEPYPAEHYTLEQLRAHPFDWNSIVEENEVTPDRSRAGKLYGQDERKLYTVPVLREYIETFKGTGLVHDTEIKSYDPAIIPVYKALVDAYDAWDQFFTISFNPDILEAIYADYPEISIGALNTAEWLYPEVYLEGESEIQAQLRTLFDAVDRWNATYNPAYMHEYGEALRAARHRGLTVWPWTYAADFDVEGFARDYMTGYAGLTNDFSWFASDYIVKIDAEDVTAATAGAIPRPMGRTQAGASQTLQDAEPILIEQLSDTQALAIWRYRTQFEINGVSYGTYCLYSNPFVVTKPQTLVFSFTKEWQGGHEDSVAFQMYGQDYAPVEAQFSRTVLSETQWRYEAQLDSDGDCFVVETVPKGYRVYYRNVGRHADAKDRCYNGGTIVNFRLPETGDHANLPLWIACVLLGLVGMAVSLHREA